MTRHGKRVLQVLFVLLLVANALGLTLVLIIGDIWRLLIVLGVVVLDLYWFYVRYFEKKQPRYPLVPPEGKGDVYLPRTNIPRPIHEDARRLEEKKKRFQKLKKLRRRSSR